MAPRHCAVHRCQGVELDHDEPPDSQGQGEPHADGVDHDAEVHVEEDDGRPGPGELLLHRPALSPEVTVHQERDVVNHHQHVRNSNA